MPVLLALGGGVGHGWAQMVRGFELLEDKGVP